MRDEEKPIRVLLILIAVLSVATFGPILAAQVATGSGQLPGASSADEWGSSIVWAYLSSQGLKWWRSHPKIGGFTDKTAKYLQQIIAALVAFAGGLGISFVFDQDTGTLAVHGLMAGTIMTSLQHWVRQYVFQEILYHGPVKAQE